MRKKLMICIVLVIGIMMSGCTSQKQSSEVKGISLEIVVEDKVNNKELFNDVITQEGEISTLYDFLKECDELEVEFGEGAYGVYIDGMMGLKQDFDKGPWWLYSSENNEMCKENGMCPGIGKLTIQDGDKIVFQFTNEF